MQAGLCRTEQRLLQFEEKYHLKTGDFISRYEKDEMEADPEMTLDAVRKHLSSIKGNLADTIVEDREERI